MKENETDQIHLSLASQGQTSDEISKDFHSLKMAEQARGIRMEAPGGVHGGAISREEAIRRACAILEWCEKARVPEIESEVRPTTGKRTIMVEVACGRWTCDGCHLLDPKEKICNAFLGERIVSRGGRYLRCNTCLEHDQLA